MRDYLSSGDEISPLARPLDPYSLFMIRIDLPASPGSGKAYRSVRSRRASPSVRHTSTIGFRLREVEIRHLPLAAKVPLSCYSGSYPQENSSSPIASGLHFQDDFQFDRRTEWNAGDAKYKCEETSLRRRHLESTPTPHRRPSRAQ